jgi:uncharacterized protein YjbJ (UPF0337 family)
VKPTKAEPTPSASEAGSAPLAGRDRTKARWKQSIGAAKLAWGKLTDDELLQIEGRADKLAGLVQERYVITRDAAVQQVKRFYATYLS